MCWILHVTNLHTGFSSPRRKSYNLLIFMKLGVIIRVTKTPKTVAFSKRFCQKHVKGLCAITTGAGIKNDFLDGAFEHHFFYCNFSLILLKVKRFVFELIDAFHTLNHIMGI